MLPAPVSSPRAFAAVRSHCCASGIPCVPLMTGVKTLRKYAKPWEYLPLPKLNQLTAKKVRCAFRVRLSLIRSLFVPFPLGYEFLCFFICRTSLLHLFRRLQRCLFSLFSFLWSYFL